MADDSADTEAVEPTESEESSQSAPEAEVPESEAEKETAEPTEPEAAAPVDDTEPARRGFLRAPTGGLVGGVLVLALVVLTGWLGYGFYQVHHEQQRRDMFVDTARQGATNLTSIDWEHAEGDVQRVLDSSTGRFYDDFEKRSKSFLDVVKQIKSKSVGTVTSSGLESYSNDTADVLVSVTVRSTNAGVPEQAPQVWRMVLTVQDIEGKAKVSNVEFIQ
ncbi:Mce protein [Mycolicibacterium neworleansense]|uniref:Mce associated membrane protein n=1 Tax=Mycolicibacterium neworleansense TaxID=146018 RepID=A0A0H5RWK7_9MYCO|nr:Mce protein [Mycolicibacterium neworleansense]MCV7360237.1 Mce protein [Mycolicibacterium neworleansense]CRZ18283.1 Mce associated membrane protein [Mycolicibacterium neworleansense]